ncbi:TetR family transcriptional regulator [Rhizobium lusitanum]|uniref:TetR family transcriptional regulator n=1 Tax=Rhizobium lusitanum TaxID=293958 RepID=A0A6L9UGU3_9HYPH|nr:TetR/AcrR family transcriptional regulator [Rhizobium lusitanum]NEI74541.1 TetR family transcriptional regulator [Rhizobium lusitanum]
MRPSKRQLVVDKATELFSQYGFQAVGIDSIIEESNVARMTLYRNFEGKDDLIRAVLEQRYAFIVDDISDRLTRVVDPTARVKTIFDWYGAWFDTPEFAGCLFERALAEFGPDHPQISDIAIRYRRKMTDWMEELLVVLMPADAARKLAEVFIMLLDGATVEARASKSSASAGRAWAAALSLLSRDV